ncbi:hypothetical protein OKW49_008159 [Paraburkholderia youngii]|uniref:hypothetical protein n=1 Tax=Paraburkholderia youngii TaxID=2782701 RepID=UPI003D190EA1
MTANRILRRLAALRKRPCRPADGRATLAGLYDRGLLFGGGALLTLSILVAAGVRLAHRFERCNDDWRTNFLRAGRFRQRVCRAQPGVHAPHCGDL